MGAALVALYLAFLSGQRALEGYRARQEVAAAVRGIEQLQAQNLTLQAELSAVQREVEIERLARAQLGLVKPGDQPLILLWPDSIPRGDEASFEAKEVDPGWRRWLHLFFDIE